VNDERFLFAHMFVSSLSLIPTAAFLLWQQKVEVSYTRVERWVRLRIDLARFLFSGLKMEE
jgi:uncharacterized membrane protein